MPCRPGGAKWHESGSRPTPLRYKSACLRPCGNGWQPRQRRQNRSLNSEVLWRLGQTFGEEWLRFIAGVEEREKREKELREQLYQDPAYKDFVERRMAELMEKDPDLRKDK